MNKHNRTITTIKAILRVVAISGIFLLTLAFIFLYPLIRQVLEEVRPYI